MSDEVKFKNRLYDCLTYIQISKSSDGKHLISIAIKNLIPIIKFHIVKAETSFTDCISNVYICEEHMKLPGKQLAYVVCHEICHILFLHSLRETFFDFVKYHQLWNMATDYFINSLLNTYSEALEIPILYDQYGNRLELCIDKRYSHLSLGEEEIFKLLEKNNNGGEGGKSLLDSHEKWKKDNVGSGEKEIDVDEQIKINQIKNVIIDLQERAKSDPKIGSGDAIIRSLSSMYISKNNHWEKKLRFYLVKTFEKQMKYNYHRNARNNLTKYFIPATMRLNKPKPKFLFAIDTSGSICLKQLELFKGEIFRIIDAGGLVDFVACHDKISFVSENSTKKDILDFQVTKTGGTNFNPVFDFVKKNNKYDLVIYLTDGFGHLNVKSYPEFSKKTLWLINNIRGGNKGETFVKNNYPNFGHIISIS